MSVHDSVGNLLTQDIPGGRSNLSNSNKELRNLSEYCHKEIFGRGTTPPLEMTKVYAAQSLASVAYQINTLAANLVELLRLQNQQWGEMDHQINDISQQVNIFQEKRSRHLIGKLTSEKPVHQMKRVNAPAQKESVQKYERHPINFTVWDHIGHGSPTHDSSPASESPARKHVAGYRASAIMDRRSTFTPQQSTIEQDIYGTSFDVMRYAKKPVAHSIPIAHSIPRTDTSTESELTSTSELFVQGHTADSLYDTLSNTPDTGSSVDSKQPPVSNISESQEPDSTLFLPSPQREMRSPLSSPFHPPETGFTPPPPPTESMELNQSTDDLDEDLYSPEEHEAPRPLQEYLPVGVQEPPPPDPVVSLPTPEPESTPVPVPDPSATVPITKPPRPSNPFSARPSNPSPARPNNPAPSRPNNPAPPPPAVAPPPVTAPPPGVAPPPSAPLTDAPSPKQSGSRPIRSAPAPPPVGLGPKLSAPAFAPPRPPPPVDLNIPDPPSDLPKPVVPDSRIPAPPPNIPKDGLPKANRPSSSSGPPSPTKKPAPRPAPKGFDPSDIIKMQQSLKKRSAGPGRSTEGDTPQSTPDSTPSEPRSFLKDVKSTPATVTTPEPPSPSVQGAKAEASPGSIPDPPPDIPEGWTKQSLGAAKSEPVVKKATTPKPQPAVVGFNPSQILAQHRLRSSKPSSTSSTGSTGDSESSAPTTAAIPPNYIEIVETIFPYKAQKEDELNFSKGRVIYVLKKNPDEWYEGVLDGVRGLFPANYVKSKPGD